MRATWTIAGLVLCATALAGCGSPSDTTSTTHRQTSCPSWTGNLDHLAVFNIVFHENLSVEYYTYTETYPVGAFLEKDGKPLDRLYFQFRPVDEHDGGISTRLSTVQLTVTRDDDHTVLRAYDQTQGVPGEGNDGKTSWTFGPGDVPDMTLIVPLVDKTAPPRPTAVTAEWRFFPENDGNPLTPGEAQIKGTVEFFYRAC